MSTQNFKSDAGQSDLHSQSSVIVKAGDLNSFVRKVLLAAGADERNATRVAEALVSANLCGVDSHGVWHIPGYVKGIQSGELNPSAWPSILRETPSTALVSGNWTFGHVAAKFATELAIEKARQHDVSLVGLVQIHHIGRLGEYVELAAAAGMISIIWAGGFGSKLPAAVPYGGRERILHTNPIAMAFPALDGPAMSFDFATTGTSGVKVIEAREAGQPLPPGSIVDKDGNSTNDPEAFFQGGGHLPFGAHKGYAFMLAAEYMGRIFTGSDVYADAARGGAIFGHSGASICTYREDLFRPADDYKRQAQSMAARIRAIAPAPGFKEVLMPGDNEVNTRAERERDGIPLPPKLWHTLTTLATSLGVNDF